MTINAYPVNGSFLFPRRSFNRETISVKGHFSNEIKGKFFVFDVEINDFFVIFDNFFLSEIILFWVTHWFKARAELTLAQLKFRADLNLKQGYLTPTYYNFHLHKILYSQKFNFNLVPFKWLFFVIGRNFQFVILINFQGCVVVTTLFLSLFIYRFFYLLYKIITNYKSDKC